MDRLTEVLEDRPPLFVSAGVLKHAHEIEQAAENPVVAALVLGAYTDQESFGNSQGGSKQVFHYDPGRQAAFNSIGLENPGRAKVSEYLPQVIARAKDGGP